MTATLYLEWAAGFLCQLFLVWMLKTGGMSRSFPFFYTWLIFEASKSVVLFPLYQYGTRNSYFWVYWACQIVGFCLQVGICYDVFAGSVHWRNRLQTSVVIAIVLASVLTVALGFGVPRLDSQNMVAMAASLSQALGLILCGCFFLTFAATQISSIPLRRKAQSSCI